jgi:hypothetical protein
MNAPIDYERQRATIHLLKQVYVWAKRSGLLLPMRAKMITTSQHRSLIQQAKLVDPLFRHSDDDNNRPDYERISHDLKDILVTALKHELEASYIGRFLFYLIKGGKRISKDPDVYLSPLSKLLYPTTCLSVWCDNPIVETKNRRAFVKSIQSHNIGKLYCNSRKCRRGWDDWRAAIEKAIDVAYGFPEAYIGDIDTIIAILLQGHESLTDYIFTKKSSYYPRAMLFDPFSQILTVENMSQLCLMPSQFPEMSLHAGSFGKKQHIQNGDVAIRLPVELFNAEEVTKTVYKVDKESQGFEVFKKISVLQDQESDSVSEVYIALDETGSVNSNEYVLLKDLARVLVPSVENLIVSKK